MGFAYWLVHVEWTIPPAVLMTALYWPFYTRLELCKIATLVGIAVVATTPWDSYLVRNRIWTYPPEAVSGLKLFSIPLEEVFFFIIQTYNTSLLYVIITKHLVLPVYLLHPPRAPVSAAGFLAFSSILVFATACLSFGQRLTYLGLILVWVTPFILLLWAISHHFLLALPRKAILIAILAPSLYLCLVDNLALQRGTWVIEKGTKLDVQVLGSLDVEEALFFFLTNVMIVMGLAAVDHAVALAEYETAVSTGAGLHRPSYGNLMLSYLGGRKKTLDASFLQALAAAVELTSRKSQSMFIGSAVFQGALRIDLLRLYSFYRTVDDLVDEAPDHVAARLAIKQCSTSLNARFGLPVEQPLSLGDALRENCHVHQDEDLRSSLRISIAQLPASRLAIKPMLHLMAGLETDLLFSDHKPAFPILTEQDLETYAYNVAGSVAVSILGLVFHYHPALSSSSQQHLICAGEAMGCALQYINIARDIGRDATAARVYIPTTWLKSEGLSPVEVIANPCRPEVARLRRRMLEKAEEIYESTVDAIFDLPSEVRGPVMTVVDSYMAIGISISTTPVGAIGQSVKMKLPLLRRLWVARKAMVKTMKR